MEEDDDGKTIDNSHREFVNLGQSSHRVVSVEVGDSRKPHPGILTSGSSSRRVASKSVFPFDDEIGHNYPCPSPSCEYVGKTRLERTFHMRQEHPGFQYNDGVEKIVKVETITPKKANRPSTSGKSRKLGSLATNTTPAVSVEPTAEQMLIHKAESPEPSSSSSAMWEIRGAAGLLEDYALLEEVHTSESHYADSNSLQLRTPKQKEPDAGFGPRKRGRPRNPPGTEPAANSKIRVSDKNGKYRCYVPECDWRGGYRSIRAEHMKWCHKDYKLPPRYMLQRMARNGVFTITDDDPEPAYACTVPGCNWKGHFRASRISHMRIVHPEHGPRKRAPTGGYMENGRYECHYPNCAWRGGSRSTRTAHIRREHPGFVNPGYSARYLICCDCGIQLLNHRKFVEHLQLEHSVGGQVQREFTDLRNYEEWFESVQEAFSIEFVRRMPVKQVENGQVYFLLCARGAGSRIRQMRVAPYLSHYSRRRPKSTRGLRCCAAYLRVFQAQDGRVSVTGCVEHTGHRMGTPLLRVGLTERLVQDEYLYMVDEDVHISFAIDRLRENEGATADGYITTAIPADELEKYVIHENEMTSLELLLRHNHPLLFDVEWMNSGAGFRPEELNIGIMTNEMKHHWVQQCSRVVCIEEARIQLGEWDGRITFVLVMDHNNLPRCAALHLSKFGVNKIGLISHLKTIAGDIPLGTIVTDGSHEWIQGFIDVYGEAALNFDYQIAEWHIMNLWASQLDVLIPNRVDKFHIMCAMRRMLRITDSAIFDTFVSELFDAFFEMDLHEIAQMVDEHISDAEYFKRWNPVNRNPVTEYGNPALDIAVRMFSERFIGSTNVTRLDQYVGFLLNRIESFNVCEVSYPYYTGRIEQTRSLPANFYENSDILSESNVVEVVDEEQDMILDGHEILEKDQKMYCNVLGDDILVDGDVIGDETIMDEDEGNMGTEELIVDQGHSSQEHNQHPPVELNPALSTIQKSEEEPSTSHDNRPGSLEEFKNRITEIMQRLHDRVNNIHDIGSCELVEASLSQVVEQLPGDRNRRRPE